VRASEIQEIAAIGGGSQLALHSGVVMFRVSSSFTPALIRAVTPSLALPGLPAGTAAV
jgi:hypothetical protein